MTVQTLGDFEVHALPDGTSVAYRDRDHSYWRTTDGAKGSGRLTGISTVVSPFDFRPDNLMKWAARTNGAGIAHLAADGLTLKDADDIRAALSWLESGDAIWQALTDARLLYSDAKDDAADRGTNVHKHALHALASGQPVPAFGEMTDLERGYANGVVKFWLDHEPQPLHAETVVADLDLGVAGRLDLICVSRSLGGVALIDAKTSGFIPNKHHAQLAGYRRCAIRNGLVDEIDATFILQVTPAGGYELIPCTATDRSFELAVELYRDAARIARECGQARKAAEQGQGRLAA